MRAGHRAACHRIVCAVVRAEVQRMRPNGSAALPPGDWAEAIAIGEGGLGLDSLERLGAIGALAETFGLDPAALPEGGVHHVGDWVDCVSQRLEAPGATITVATSGSTGRPVLCRHPLHILEEEAAYLAGRLRGRRRIVGLVPAHHLYGLVWTALLPAALDVPVAVAALDRPFELLTGDLVVAVPEQWQALLRLYRSMPADVWGVCSGGALPDAVWGALATSGLAGFLDVYGSSETSAIAIRSWPDSSHALLPRWDLIGEGGALALRDRQGTIVSPPDEVERTGTRTLRPLRRRDDAVQIGGHNVWPARVAAMLEAMPGVAQAAVRLGANGRLKAFVVPDGQIDQEALCHDLEARVARMPEPERPNAFRFGRALPRNAMGKLTDWS